MSPNSRYDYLELQNVALFGNIVFADVIKARIKMCSYSIRVGLKSSEKCPCKRQKREHRDTEGCGTTETELEGCSHKLRNPWSPQELEEAGRILPWSF